VRHVTGPIPIAPGQLEGGGCANCMYGATGAAAGLSNFEVKGMGTASDKRTNYPVHVQDMDTGFDAVNGGGQIFGNPHSR
jgi:hypothetical protein